MHLSAQRSAATQHARSAPSRQAVVVAAAAPSADKKAAPSPSAGAPAPAQSAQPLINVIPVNGRDAGRAINGIPPVMGAHLMPSGVPSPMSVSKGPGLDVHPALFDYPGREGDAAVILHFSKQGVAQALVKSVLEAAEAAVASKGSFTLVLSGGSLLSLLSGLADSKVKAAWDKWHVFYVDERNVPHSSPDSNHRGAVEAFLGKVPIPPSNIFAILENVPVQQAAINYEGRLIALSPSILPRNPEGFPVFDQILLGIGPDGHIASLFPNRPQTAATTGWVLAVSDSPKPPPERITFTLPVINAAKDIILTVIGAEKAEIAQRLLEVQALPGALPAQLVRPASGSLRVFLDVPSAQSLDITNWADSKAFPRSQ